MSDQLELQLPYEEVGKIEGTTYVRDNYNRSHLVAYKIPFNKIKIREGYNVREVYEDIPELAESIYSEKLKTPFDLIVTKDDVFLKRGHRRHKAIELLIEQGRFNPEDEVLFFPVKNDETEEEMTIDLETSNMTKPLSFLGQSKVAYRLKYCFGEEKSNEDVALKMKKSRQTIDNLIMIAKASDEIKNEIFMAEMTITQALTLIKGDKRNKKQAEKAELDANKNSAGKTQLPVDINAKELAELHELEKDDSNLEPVFDLPDDPGEEPRVSTYDPNVPHETKPLDLVGNTVANESSSSEKKDKDGSVKYDENREEIAKIQNAIKLNDRASVRVEKLDISDGDKKDLLEWLRWQMNDLEVIREWIHKNKKENKAR